MIYDYIIIGGGPTGLTLAWCLSRYDKKIALIDKNDSLGGCHRVNRINGLFSEHGPRLISNSKIFIKILDEMNIDFYKIYSEYKKPIIPIIKQIYNNLTKNEIIILFYKILTINDNDKKYSLLDFFNNYNFSNKARIFLNSFCQLLDCIDSSNMILYNFLYNINLLIYNNGYQPKYPNDIGLFRLWKKALLKNNVDIFLNTNVLDMTNSKNKITSIKCNNDLELNGLNFIFAIPPSSISDFLNSSNNINIKNSFGNLNLFNNLAKNTNYLTYIPIIFHWDSKLDLNSYYGLPFTNTPWIIIFNVLSDDMIFNDNRSKTVISTCISQHKISKNNNKLPNECTEEELKIETFLQLLTIFPNLPKPTYSILSQNYYDGKKWISKDTAFAYTKYGFINSKSYLFDNLYNCGTHNLENYTNTRLKTAIVSAIKLLNELIPESKKKYFIEYNDILLKNIVFYIIIIVIVIFLLYKTRLMLISRK